MSFIPASSITCWSALHYVWIVRCVETCLRPEPKLEILVFYLSALKFSSQGNAYVYIRFRETQSYLHFQQCGPPV